MKRRFITLLVVEQSTEDSNMIIDKERLHDQIIDSVQSDDYGVEVIATQTVVEVWDPETNVYLIEDEN